MQHSRGYQLNISFALALYDWESWQSLLCLETKQMKSQSHSQTQVSFTRVSINQIPSYFHWSFLLRKPNSSGCTAIEIREFKSTDAFLKLIFRSQCFAAQTQNIPVPWSSEFFRNLGFKMGWILRTQRRAEDKVYGVDLQTSESEAETQQRVVVEMDEERKVWKWKQAIKFPDSLDIWGLLEKRYGYD